MDKMELLINEVLNGANVSALDAARFVRNILDAKPKNCSLTDAQFILKVIEAGIRNIRASEMPFNQGFAIYYESKKHLRKDSLRDICCIGNRLIKTKPELAKCNFSQLTVIECEMWINTAFATPSQQNKARAMLHALFEFAIRRNWCDKNPIKHIEKRRVIEKEILPLKLSQIRRLIEVAKGECGGICLPAVALLIYAGIRPREVRRLTWQDIDLQENTITIRSLCSKTGGVRQVEIMPQLKRILSKTIGFGKICPKNWERRWQNIRQNSGFSRKALPWQADVLRHTFASFFAKRFKDLPRLQLNMGHSNQMLLKSRYINMRNISRAEAEKFFN